MLKLGTKQLQVIAAVKDPTVHTIVLIGAVGTGKTDIAAHASISICYHYKNTYWPVIRQNLSTARRSVIPSYLEVLDRMNLFEGQDFTFNRQENTITFHYSNSTIPFIEADITKDRQGRKLKGINASGNHIDEADEIDQLMFVTATSRRGRKNQHGQPSLSIITMNPNDTYLKKLYYEPWKNGTLPPGVRVIEFTIEDSWQTDQDIQLMLSNPRPWVERYLKNNWEYTEDDNSLFKYRLFDMAITRTISDTERRYIGYDVARSGTDRSVLAHWNGRTLVDIQIVKDKDEQMMTDDQALEVIKYMTQNAIVAENVSIDAVGVGVGVIDHMKSKGIYVKSFVSGARPTVDSYDNLRSQVIFELSQGLEKGTIKIYEGCPFRNELISEAMAHQHNIGDKKLSVESKEKVKERTGGLSPDILDAVVMGLYPQLNIDPKYNTNRIGF